MEVRSLTSIEAAIRIARGRIENLQSEKRLLETRLANHYRDLSRLEAERYEARQREVA